MNEESLQIEKPKLLRIVEKGKKQRMRRASLDTLNDNVKKLNSDVGLQNNSLQEELSRLHGKISFVEKNIGQKVELLEDNYKSFTTIVRKEKDNAEQLHGKISEVAENLKNLENKIEGYAEQNNKIFEEYIKKISKNYEAVHKKHLQKMQDQYSQIDKTVRKMNSTVESSVKNIKISLKDSLDEKFASMHDYLKTTAHEFVQLFGMHKTNSLINQQTPQKRICNLSENDLECSKNKKLMADYDSDYNNQNSNAGMLEMAQTSSMRPTHTPISHFLNRYENKAEHAKKYQVRSTIKPEVSNYNDTVNHFHLRIRRKFSTPLRKMISPKFKKPMQNATNSYCTPLISKLTSNEAFFNKNETAFPKEYGDIRNKAEYRMNDSPAITVIEAATIAKRQYDFHSYYTQRR